MRVLALCCVVSMVMFSVAGNLHLEIVGDVRRVIDLGVFAFNENGYVSLQVHDLFISDPELFISSTGHIHDEPLGFVLDTTTSAQSARVEKNYAKGDGADHRRCFINDPDLVPATRISFPINGKKADELRDTVFEAKVTVPGLYALFYYNCKGFNDTSSSYLRPVPVSYAVHATMYSIDASGVKHYLSWADQSLPMMYGFFFAVFVALTVAWWRVCRANPLHLHRVHHVMTFLLIVKSLSLLFDSVKLHHYDATGAHSVWDVFYYVALTVKGVTLFSVLLLLGSGWSVMKQFLGENDKKILMILLPCQILINISIAMISETSEGAKHWSSWYDMLQILDVVCCCCVLLPIVWSIKNLRDASAQDDKAARAIGRMKKFRTFYIVIVAYIYFTRIILVMIENSLPYDKMWYTKAATELVAALFYLYTGIKFQPMAENPYLEVERDDAEELGSRNEVSSVTIAKE